MLDDNNNKDDKGYSFIQEQIASKKKLKAKRMLFSLGWTIVLAGVFGVVAGVAFCISQPTIEEFLGITQDKKTVEFPTTVPGETGEVNQEDNSQNSGEDTAVNNNGEDQNEEEPSKDNVTSNDGQEDSDEPINTKPETVIIENYIKGDINDLSNIYLELRSIANEVNHSIVKITSINNGVDVFNHEFEATNVTTGLIVANNGADLLILLSYDKIEKASNIQVSFSDSLQLEGRLQTYDGDLNLAVIAVSLEDIPELNLNYIKPATLGESYSLIVGSPVIALGSPNGYADSMEFGIITSKGSSVYITDNKIDTFTTDVEYNSNSEGVIVNLKGEVIGIITQHLIDEMNSEVNTSIGISRVKKIIENMVNNTERNYFGIKAADMTESALSKAGVVNGICVTEVEADSPALEAGLISGDIILSINDTPIISVNTFASLLSLYEPKSSIKVTLKRSVKNTFKDMELEVTLGKRNK